LQEALQAEVDTLKQHEDKLSYEVQHYKSVLSDTVRRSIHQSHWCRIAAGLRCI